jgi:hypothetical protein
MQNSNAKFRGTSLQCLTVIVRTQAKSILEHAAETRQRHQQDLYQSWNSQVFDKIQGRIHTELGRRSIKQLEAEKRVSTGVLAGG